MDLNVTVVCSLAPGEGAAPADRRRHVGTCRRRHRQAQLPRDGGIESEE